MITVYFNGFSGNHLVVMAYSIEKYSKAVNIYIYMCKLEARNFPYPRFCNKKNWMIGLHGFEFC